MLPVRKRVGGEQHTRLATGAVALGKVAALDHKVLDDAVEARPLIAKALLARGERAEVLGRLGRGLSVEADDDAAEGLVALGDVEEDLVRDLGALDGLDRLREEEDADAEQQRGRQEEFPEVEHDGRFGGWFLALSNWREEKIWRFRSRSMAAGERFKRDQSIAVRGQRGGFGFTHSAGEGRRRSSLRYDSRRHRESPGVGLRGSNRRTVRTGRKGERVTTTPPPPPRRACAQLPVIFTVSGHSGMPPGTLSVLLPTSSSSSLPRISFHNHGAHISNEAMPHGHAPNHNAPLMPTTPPPS